MIASPPSLTLQLLPYSQKPKVHTSERTGSDVRDNSVVCMHDKLSRVVKVVIFFAQVLRQVLPSA